MVEASLLTDDVRALVGWYGDPVAVTVTPRAVQRVEDVARGQHGPARPAGSIAPASVLLHLAAEVDVKPMPTLLPDNLLVTNEVSLERPLRTGEVLTARYRIVDIRERFGGRYGYSLLFQTQIAFTGADGDLAGSTSHTMMQFDLREVRDG